MWQVTRFQVFFKIQIDKKIQTPDLFIVNFRIVSLNLFALYFKL